MHGKTSKMSHDNKVSSSLKYERLFCPTILAVYPTIPHLIVRQGVFKDMPADFDAVRYHSLVGLRGKMGLISLFIMPLLYILFQNVQLVCDRISPP
jgi:hypothetical protein